MPPVSVTIITLDEAEHIAAAIDSAAWADEIVVVDSRSRDGTADIARARGVRVIERDWAGQVRKVNIDVTVSGNPRYDSPVTVTVSSTEPTRISTLMGAVKSDSSTIRSRTTVWNPASVNVTV